MVKKSYNGFASEEEYLAVKETVSRQIGEFCCDEFEVSYDKDIDFVKVSVRDMEFPLNRNDLEEAYDVDWVEFPDGARILNSNDLAIIRTLCPYNIGRAMDRAKITAQMPF